MALKSSVVGPLPEGEGYQVLVEDELVGRTTVKEVPIERCAEFAGDLLPAAPSALAALLGSIARTLAVRDYLREIGEDPDAPSLG